MSVQTAHELGLMEGFPIPAERQVTLENWQDAPYHRWAFQHVSDLIPTAQIDRGGPVWELPRVPRGLDALTFEVLGERMTIAEMLDRTYTDGFLVLKEGAVVAEKYFNGMGPGTKHLLMSVSKSVVGMLAGVLVDRGQLDLAALCSRYVPELSDSAYGDATVQQVLDMTVSVVFNEDYDDPSSEVQQQDRAAGWRPAREGDPAGSYQFLTGLKKAWPHGEIFQYCSGTTDALGWILERATGERLATILSRQLWAPLGAEHDAYITVDRYNAPYANGGICVTLRDLARFGQMVLAGGFVGDWSVVPSWWIDETRRGDNGPWLRSDYWPPLYPNGSYHNQWYNTADEHGSFFGSGIYGQHLWIDPTAGVVIAKLSSRPTATGDEVTQITHAAFRAIAGSV